MAVTKRKRVRNGRKYFVYFAEVFFKGKRVTSKTFGDEADAYHWHNSTKDRIESGGSESKSLTVSDVVVNYKNSAFRNLRKSSQQSRESRFRHILQSPLSKVELKNLDANKIADWIQFLKRERTALNRNRLSFEGELKTLKKIFNWHREENDYRFMNPITRSHFRSCKIQSRVRRPDYYLKEAEVLSWLQALRQRPDPVYYRLGLCMTLTGLRLGEASGLCWDAVDLNSKRANISVIRTLSWDYRTKEPYFADSVKTDQSVRTVPIDSYLANELRTIKINSDLKSNAVFLNTKGRLLSDNTVRSNFNAAFRACGLNWTGSHIMRHTFATLGLMAEKNMAPIQATLGHTSQTMTEKYAKVIALRDSRASEKVASLIGLNSAAQHQNHVGLTNEVKSANDD